MSSNEVSPSPTTNGSIPPQLRRKHPCVLCQQRKVKCDRNEPCQVCAFKLHSLWLNHGLQVSSNPRSELHQYEWDMVLTEISELYQSKGRVHITPDIAAQEKKKEIPWSRIASEDPEVWRCFERLWGWSRCYQWRRGKNRIFSSRTIDSCCEAGRNRVECYAKSRGGSSTCKIFIYQKVFETCQEVCSCSITIKIQANMHSNLWTGINEEVSHVLSTHLSPMFLIAWNWHFWDVFLLGG